MAMAGACPASSSARQRRSSPRRRIRVITANTAAKPDKRRAARPQGGRPSRDAAAQLAGRILESARTLFLAEGFGATSVEAITQRAGVSKRTFYARFDDKADIFEAVLHDVVERLRPARGIPFVEGDP